MNGTGLTDVRTYERTDGQTSASVVWVCVGWLSCPNWNEMETKSKQRYVCSLARSLTDWQQCFFCLAFGTREQECVSEWHSRSNLLLWCSSTNQNVCSSPKCKTRIHFFGFSKISTKKKQIRIWNRKRIYDLENRKLEKENKIYTDNTKENYKIETSDNIYIVCVFIFFFIWNFLLETNI